MTKKENIYYAPGGGMGHITRAKAFIYTTRQNEETFFIVTSSRYADLFFPEKCIVKIPTHFDLPGIKKWLSNFIQENTIKNVYLDTFPAGIIGEWNLKFSVDINFYYIARLLKWERYFPLIKEIPLFKKTYFLETLYEEHENFIKKKSQFYESFFINYPKKEIDKTIIKQFKTSQENWLIVHSEPEEEVESLINYSKDYARLNNKKPNYIVLTTISTKKKTDINYMKTTNAYQYFEYADKIITAAGFNIMQQIKPYADKHKAIPFDRLYDNQFFRLKNQKKSMTKKF